VINKQNINNYILSSFKLFNPLNIVNLLNEKSDIPTTRLNDLNNTQYNNITEYVVHIIIIWTYSSLNVVICINYTM